MTLNVNPFEPWRPSGKEVPEAPHQRPHHAEPRRPPPAPAPRHRSASGLRPDQKWLIGLLVVLLFLLPAGLAWYNGLNHFPRVFGALLAAGLGLGAGISLARSLRWPARLALITAGLAGAALVVWFLPTTGGLSLWSAQRRLAGLEALPAGDLAGYAAGADGRRQLKEEFPTFEPEVAAAEQSWVRRAVDAAVEEAEGLRENDPSAAASRLRAVAAAVAGGDHYNLVRDKLQAAQRQTLLARLESARKELQTLLDRGRFADVAQRGGDWARQLGDEARGLGAEAEVDKTLRGLRRKAVLARLDSTRRETLKLLAGDRYREIVAAAERLAADMGAEAETVGAARELDSFRRSCRFLGELAQAAKQPDPGNK